MMINFSREIPFNDLPLLPVDMEIESREVLYKTISASRALAQLNGALINLPNPTLFLDTIHLQEAKASSEIENIVTTGDDLFQSVIAEKKFKNPAIKEVLRYKDALWLGLAKLESRPMLTTNLCIEIVQCIKQNTSEIRKTPGTTLKNESGKILYTPPVGENVIREKLANLEKFINEDNIIDPLIKMAIMHYQFEAIHPFTDGNGRTGRILLLLYLKLANLLDIPAIFFSEYIIQNKSEYYKRLLNVTEKKEWPEYILYMLDMVETTAKSSLNRIEKIATQIELTAEEMRAQLPKIYSKDLVEIIFKLPYTKRQTLINSGFGTLKTVGNYLIQLEEHGFLRSVKVGKEKLYLNHELMRILES